jgi:hypothetical protein
VADFPGEKPGDDRVADLDDFLRILGGDGPDLDDDLAYDGSDGPQQRPLEEAELGLLHRVIGLVADDRRWQLEEVARRPEIRSVIGDGTQPQARDLTARERDDVCRMVMLLTGDIIDPAWPAAPARPAYLPALASGETGCR